MQNNKEKYIIACSADKIIKVLNLEGTQISYVESEDIYTAMGPIGIHSSLDAQNEQKWRIGASTNKPSVFYYYIDCDTAKF